MRAGARLSKGRNNGDNTWSLSPEELENVLYLPPDDRVHEDRLALRIIELNEDGGTTLAVLEFPLAPTDALPAPTTASARVVAAEKDDAERERLHEELAAAKELAAAREAELTELRRAVEAAGITVEGLIELIDIAERLPAMPIKGKLTELDCLGRNLRVFETDDPAVLMILEKAGAERSEYGIERDEGLVQDLRLFARAKELL